MYVFGAAAVSWKITQRKTMGEMALERFSCRFPYPSGSPSASYAEGPVHGGPGDQGKQDVSDVKHEKAICESHPCPVQLPHDLLEEVEARDLPPRD